MKHINFKTVRITTPTGIESDFDYRANLRIIVAMPLSSQQGVSLDEARKGIRVLDAIDKADDNGMDLEDSDYAFLCERVTNAKWPFVHSAYTDFVDSITGL